MGTPENSSLAVLQALGMPADELAGWALRYFLGRQSAAAGSFALSLPAAVPHISTGQLQLMGRDIGGELIRHETSNAPGAPGPLGSALDYQTWKIAHAAILAELSKREGN